MAAGIAVLGILVFAPDAGAITYGVPDGNGHPEVGVWSRRKQHGARGSSV